MGSEESEATVKSKRHDMRKVARKALSQLFEPLAGFVIDAGLGTQELHSILREAVVRSVAARQLEAHHRVNISGIAATTGIPRAEISRILNSKASAHGRSVHRQEKSTNRILAAWHEEPKFTNASGQPADLKLYGRGATFESLVKCHGRGIPTRAVLDELVRARAVEVLSSQKVRAKVYFAVDRGITPQAVRAFGDRATELLSTMLLNMRKPEKSQFVASVSGSSIPSNTLPLIRRELSNKSAEFLADIQESLIQQPSNSETVKGLSTVSVTVFSHESLGVGANEKRPSIKRRNFRRKS
jgi:hypothetical protein